MRKWTFIIFVLTFGIFSYSNAQSKLEKLSIGGVVVDTLKAPLINASVFLVRNLDTATVAFTVTDEDGDFTLSKIDTGTYTLNIHYLGFKGYQVPLVHVGVEKLIDFGQISLSSANQLLETVEIVAERIPIRIDNDTVIYNAEAFKLEKNADLEALLKKLPGVEVDENGKITAQGEEIFQILVDGEEFFSTDPKIATKNLPADAVAKIQVFEKETDQAKFTGIKDGNEQKTINIKLKEDRKKGYFGKVSGGYGSQDRYQIQTNINRFNKTTQFSVIGGLNNINQQGFSGIESFQSGGQGGGQNLNPLGGAGFNKTGFGGINFNHKFSKKTKLVASYFLNDAQNESDGTKNTQNILPNRVFFQNEQYDNVESGGDHRASFRFDIEIDSFQKIQLNGSANLGQQKTYYHTETQTTDTLDFLQSDAYTDRRTDRQNNRWSSSITYFRKLVKKGRNFSTSYSFNKNSSLHDRTLLSDHIYYEDVEVIKSIDTIRQLQNMENSTLSWNLNSTFTEPVGDKKYLSFSYRHSNQQNDNGRDVFQLESRENLESEYQIDTLSTGFDRLYFFDRAKLQFRSNQEKVNVSFGISGQRSYLKGKIANEQDPIEKSFLNVLPEAQLRWRITNRKNIRISYTSSVREPTLRQLQPIVENQNPLNIYVGNPSLVPSYQHRIRGSYNSFNQSTLTSFFANVSANLVENPIIYSKTIDAQFRTISQPINADHQKSINASINFSRPLPLLNWVLSLNSTGGWSESPAYIDRQEDVRTNNSLSWGIKLRADESEFLQYWMGWERSTTNTAYKNNPNSERTYFTDRMNASLVLNFFKKWQIFSSLNYTVYGGNAFTNKQKIPILQASISTSLLPGDRLQLKLTGYDLLNQNQGINRSSSVNRVEELTVRSLARIFMVSAIYSIKSN